MLVSFSVSNFRSFDEEQTFSLVASKHDSSKHQSHTRPVPDSEEHLLRTAVLYGANGAGKSNLFKALQFVDMMVVNTRDWDEPLNRERFLLRQNESPSTFDLQFVSKGKLFRYWIKVDDSKVIQESLTWIRNGVESTIYERLTSVEGNVQVVLGKNDTRNENWDKIEALAMVGGPRNQSFLATVSATLDRMPAPFADSIDWFVHQLRLISPQESGLRWKGLFQTEPELLTFSGAFLNAASTGVDHLVATEKEISEEDALRFLNPRVRKSWTLRGEAIGLRQVLENGDLLTATRSGEDVRYTLTQLKSVHRGTDDKAVSFDIQQESDGTRRLMQLIPALHSLHQESKCYFIDEIDRSLHPMLVYGFLRFFLRSFGDKDGQLIITTHETNLLDQDLLRRDEIWFAEKNRQGATNLYSLLDFDPRNDEHLRKNYMQGRFGAVPFLGGIERLLENNGKAD